MPPFMRQSLSEYREQAGFINGGGPDVRTLRRGIDRFEEKGLVTSAIPGERIGGEYYVWVEPGSLRLAKSYAAQVSPATATPKQVKPVNKAAANLLDALGVPHGTATQA